MGNNIKIGKGLAGGLTASALAYIDFDMKKCFACLLFISAANIATAQSVLRGTVKEKSGAAISHVTVSTGDGRHVTLTNGEGAFALSYPSGTTQIVFEHIGYKPLFIAITQLPTDGLFYLEQEQLMLDEVVVMNIAMDKYIQDLIKSSIAQMKSPLQLNTYYREFINLNKRYVRYSDGLLDYNISRKGKLMNTEIKVSQSRAISFPTPDEESYTIHPMHIQDIVEDACNFDMLEMIFTRWGNYKDYNFTIKSQKTTEGQVIETIFFRPTQNVEKALCQGTIAYDPAKKRILAIYFIMSPHLRKYAKAFKETIHVNALLERFSYQSTFKIINDQYMLSHLTSSGTKHIYDTDNDIQNVYITKGDLMVTNFTADFDRFRNREEYPHQNLYSAGTNYTDKFWLANNSIQLTPEEEAIVKEIESQSEIKTN
jgi:hypothetical protein